MASPLSDADMMAVGCVPSFEADAGCEATTDAAIETAHRWIKEGWSSVSGDPNGGLVFEKQACNGLSHTLQIWEDGTAERIVFDGTRLISRSKV